MAVKSGKMVSDFWCVSLIAGCQILAAWLMAAWLNRAYPPVPMFLAAIAAGLLYQGRPQYAARSGLLAGAALGWMVEWAYIHVRMADSVSEWRVMNPWEWLGLAASEIVLYTALLGFFAAFIAWGINSQKKIPAEATAPAPDPEVPREPIPFNPAEDEGTVVLPKFNGSHVLQPTEPDKPLQ